MRRMADADPELAARLVLQSLPAAAARPPAGLSYRLELEDLGAWRVEAHGDRAEVSEVDGGGDLNGEAFAISTDARTLARLAAGGSPIACAARGPAEAARQAPQGARPPRPLAGRRAPRPRPARPSRRSGSSLPLACLRDRSRVDPGHRFTVGYELVGEGRWQLARRGGRRAHQHRGRARRRAGRPGADPLLGLAADARRRDHPAGGDAAGADRGRRPDPAGDFARALDRSRRGCRWTGVRARGAPATAAGAECRQLGQQGQLQRRVGRRRRPGRGESAPGAA